MENINKGRKGSLSDTESDSAALDMRTEADRKGQENLEPEEPGRAVPDMCAETEMRVVYGDCTLGLHGKDFDYIFNYSDKGLESLVKNGREWMYRGPVPTFWRALTDNDRGCGFHLSSGIWLAADKFICCAGVKVLVDGEDKHQPDPRGNNCYTGAETAETAEIVYTYATVTVPAATVEVSYRVNAGGQILVGVHYHGLEGLPELPVFGMRFVLPILAKGYTYEGLSGETYPDRMAGGVPGIYEVEGLPVTPYLVPQDCGMHMETKWVRIHPGSSNSNVTKGPLAPFGAGEPGIGCGKGAGQATVDARCKEDSLKDWLEIRMEDAPFAFSCLPYTALELENATHQEELPPARRTVLCVLGAVRGLGGRDSWYSPPEPAYHIDAAKDIRYSFRIV